jgi:hypothetical protein
VSSTLEAQTEYKFQPSRPEKYVFAISPFTSAIFIFILRKSIQSSIMAIPVEAVAKGPLDMQPPQAVQNHFSSLWDKHGKSDEPSPHQRYRRVVVLMVYWEESDMDVKPEVSYAPPSNLRHPWI